MAEIRKQGAPVNVMRKTFSGISNMLNVASTMETHSTPTASQWDDIFYVTTRSHARMDEMSTNGKKERKLLPTDMMTYEIERLQNLDITDADLVTSLKEYLALGSFALFWMVDELTEEVVNMNWKETENYIDSGLFVMRHMETYNGTLKKWNPGFKRKQA
nr:uncharacterized protein LOC109158392 [Ipomoea batatas]